jgi:hypothetical protein
MNWEWSWLRYMLLLIPAIALCQVLQEIVPRITAYEQIVQARGSAIRPTCDLATLRRFGFLPGSCNLGCVSL